MKKLRKIFALLIAMVMVLGMSTSVFAATITVTQKPGADGTAGNESYVAYKIFDVTKTDAVKDWTTDDSDLGAGTEEGFSYTIPADSSWLTAVRGTGAYDLTLSADGSVYTVEIKDGYNTEAAAKTAAAYLLENAPADAAKVEFTSNDTPVTVNDGYYLITSSLGTNLILATANVNLTTKNEYVVDEKVAETASVTIGENATYYIKVYLPETIDTTKKVTVHDDLDAELSFNADSVKVVESATDPGTTVAEYKALSYGALTDAYSLKTTGLTDTCDFEIEITTTNLAGKWVVFQYTAELTSEADPDGDGYVNNEFSTYSNYKTTPSTPVVKTYDFDFTKVDGDGEKLDGAEFELRATADGDPIALIADGNNYKKADSDDATTVNTITVNSKTNNAATKISGLGGTAAGTDYYLVETKAPVGFNKLSAPIIVNIKDDGTITVSLDGKTIDSPSDAFYVENNSGTVLPSTGGMGTTIFYIIGAILVIGAGVVLVTRRRMNAN